MAQVSAQKMLFGLEVYCETYCTMNDKVTLSMHDEEFDDWHVYVPFSSEQVKVLCCPVDIQCSSRGHPSNGHAANEICMDCSAPICQECVADIYPSAPTMPRAGLSNDMMIYYAPPILHDNNVTVMEMICASVCITSMISFTLEKKYRGGRAMDQGFNANKHRMAARGNATTFLLPWEKYWNSCKMEMKWQSWVNKSLFHDQEHI